MSGMTDHLELILDGTKIAWHVDRVHAWERGERIAPITIDMALTRACNYACHFCYAMLQENDREVLSTEVMYRFLDDCAEVGVRGISFVSDGESTIVRRHFRGSENLYCLRLPSGHLVHSSQPSSVFFPAGTRVRAEARVIHVVAFPADTRPLDHE